MTAAELPQNLIQNLTQVFQTFPELNLAILYGSVAAGTARPDSDIDIAVAIDSRTPIPYETLLRISSEIGARTGREAQVRDLSQAQGVFLQQVLTKGIVVLQRDSTVRAHLIIRMLDFVEDMLPNVRMIRTRNRERFLAGQ